MATHANKKVGLRESPTFCFARRRHSEAVAAADCAASVEKTPTCGEHNDRTHQKKRRSTAGWACGMSLSGR